MAEILRASVEFASSSGCWDIGDSQKRGMYVANLDQSANNTCFQIISCYTAK